MKIMRNGLVLAAGLAASLAAATPALADSTTPQSSFVRQHAIELLEGALTDEQMTTLQLVAYQAAIAAACQGFSLDQAKFEKVFNKLAPPAAANLTDDQRAYFDSHILVIYGVLIGGELAAMSDDLSTSCATAEQAKTNPDLADELVWE